MAFKYLGVNGVRNRLLLYIEVEEKDLELAKQRMEALVKRWDKNEMEMYNNGNPIYTRNTYFETLLSSYLDRHYLVDGPEIEHQALDIYDYEDDEITVEASYTFKRLDESYW